MLKLHANWDGEALHLWALRAPERTKTGVDDPSSTESPVGVTDSDFVPCDELRRWIGDRWDSLLVADAVTSQLRLRLPTYCAAPSEPNDRIGGTNGGPSPTSTAVLQEWSVPSLAFGPTDAVDLLTASRAGDVGHYLSDSVLYWSRAATLVLELLARQRFVPDLHRAGVDSFRGFWRVVVDDESVSRHLHALIVSMPPVCRSLCVEGEPMQASQLVERFLWKSVDAFVRRCLEGDELAHTILDPTGSSDTVEMAWLRSLVRNDSLLDAPLDVCERAHGLVRPWLEKLQALAADRTCRTCFRLQAPKRATADGSGPRSWTLQIYLQATHDPSIVLDAERVSIEFASGPEILPRPFANALAQLRLDVTEAARHFPPLSPCGEPDGPVAQELTIEEAYAFLRDAAPILDSKGFGVSLPKWWHAERPKLRMHLDLHPIGEPGTSPSSAIGIDALVSYDWKVALGDDELTPDELAHLAEGKTSLVKVRGQWTEVHPSDVQTAAAFLRSHRPGRMTVFEALRQCYIADDLETGLPVTGLRAHGWLETLLDSQEFDARMDNAKQPAAFQGEMRPYQVTGMNWLRFLTRLGLGGCLADDMGLGKTIQFIALLLSEREDGDPPGPTLLVVPTSLVGNWQRESERFAPKLRVMVQHGLERLTGKQFVEEVGRHDLVISTYALTHRDFEHLAAVEWYRIALDEAQNIKNPAAKQSVAVRALRAVHRVALTGTPVENRLSELWSILDFLNPSYLGTAADFRRRFAVPIERNHDADRAQRLRHLIRPFILRRLKSDPSIQIDLPDKMEMKVFCNLTREQAALYQAVVGEMLGTIDRSGGMQRRGLILSALVKLKQICNHPVQFLGDGTELPNRSGKCDRLTEMLEEVLAEGDRALVFTQYRQMGELLDRLLREKFDLEVLFLHGGTPRLRRDELVERFQSGDRATPVFLLSLKAGGFGLNLTAANHVFHYDRWWNPAVEDQATDRAHRIGQHRQVQVHKFVCMGTLEERIDALLEKKRNLAENIVGTGEEWLTEMSTDQLRDLFTLSREAVVEAYA